MSFYVQVDKLTMITETFLPHLFSHKNTKMPT